MGGCLSAPAASPAEQISGPISKQDHDAAAKQQRKAVTFECVDASLVAPQGGALAAVADATPTAVVGTRAMREQAGEQETPMQQQASMQGTGQPQGEGGMQPEPHAGEAAPIEQHQTSMHQGVGSAEVQAAAPGEAIAPESSVGTPVPPAAAEGELHAIAVEEAEAVTKEAARTEEAGPEEAGPEEPKAEEQGPEKAGAEEVGTEKPEAEEEGAEKPKAEEEAGAELTGAQQPQPETAKDEADSGDLDATQAPALLVPVVLAEDIGAAKAANAPEPMAPYAAVSSAADDTAVAPAADTVASPVVDAAHDKAMPMLPAAEAVHDGCAPPAAADVPAPRTAAVAVRPAADVAAPAADEAPQLAQEETEEPATDVVSPAGSVAPATNAAVPPSIEAGCVTAAAAAGEAPLLPPVQEEAEQPMPLPLLPPRSPASLGLAPEQQQPRLMLSFNAPGRSGLLRERVVLLRDQLPPTRGRSPAAPPLPPRPAASTPSERRAVKAAARVATKAAARAATEAAAADADAEARAEAAAAALLAEEEAERAHAASKKRRNASKSRARKARRAEQRAGSQQASCGGSSCGGTSN